MTNEITNTVRRATDLIDSFGSMRTTGTTVQPDTIAIKLAMYFVAAARINLNGPVLVQKAMDASEDIQGKRFGASAADIAQAYANVQLVGEVHPMFPERSTAEGLFRILNPSVVAPIDAIVQSSEWQSRLGSQAGGGRELAALATFNQLRGELLATFPDAFPSATHPYGLAAKDFDDVLALQHQHVSRLARTAGANPPRRTSDREPFSMAAFAAGLTQGQQQARVTEADVIRAQGEVIKAVYAAEGNYADFGSPIREGAVLRYWGKLVRNPDRLIKAGVDPVNAQLPSTPFTIDNGPHPGDMS